MRSVTTRHFRALLAKMPDADRQRARRAYKLFQQNPAHPSLNFKKVVGFERTYSARIGISIRALAELDDELVLWFWIGSHGEYERLTQP